MSTKVREKLESIGLDVTSYRRGPVGKHNFAISLDGDKVKMWDGAADITVSTNKRSRQAVVNVIEKAHSIKTSVVVFMGKEDLQLSDDAILAKLKTLHRYVRGRCNIIVPNSRMTILGFKKMDPRGDNKEPYYVRVQVKFTTRKTNTSFLVGFDTHATRPFICQLKQPVTTVAEAHKELRPATVKSNAKRQGEWFFKPVNREIRKELYDNIHRAKNQPLNGWSIRDGWYGGGRFANTTHRGMVLTLHGKTYAIGKIKDMRMGRHEPLYLREWHEVIRNNEVVVLRQQTWD